jgi:hypothetical protein
VDEGAVKALIEMVNVPDITPFGAMELDFLYTFSDKPIEGSHFE